MDIERLKELVQAEDSDLWDYKVELIGLLDEAIARQSVKSEEVADVEVGMTREEHLAQRMKSWRFRLWYRWYGFLFKIKMMLGRDVK